MPRVDRSNPYAERRLVPASHASAKFEAAASAGNIAGKGEKRFAFRVSRFAFRVFKFQVSGFRVLV